MSGFELLRGKVLEVCVPKDDGAGQRTRAVETIFLLYPFVILAPNSEPADLLVLRSVPSSMLVRPIYKFVPGAPRLSISTHVSDVDRAPTQARRPWLPGICGRVQYICPIVLVFQISVVIPHGPTFRHIDSHERAEPK